VTAQFFGLTEWLFRFSHSLGRAEYNGTGFRRPVDLALGADDFVYVLNRSLENRPDAVRVTVCTLDEQYIGEFGSYGEGDGQFIWPTSIVLDSEGNVYVADEWLNRISVYTKDGEFIRKWGVPGSNDGELDRPAGLVISEDGTLFLTDSRNHRVQKFTLDGQYLGQFGRFGNQSEELNMPWGITLDKDGQVYVADWRNDRVQVFTPEGRWQATFGRSGTGNGELRRPNSVAVDKDGIVYVVDWGNHRVQIFNPDGRHITTLKGDNVLSQWAINKLTSNPDLLRQWVLAEAWDSTVGKRFALACSVKVDDQNRILVLENTRNRIQVYQKARTPVLVGGLDAANN
jgi:DNA-binding beta-propeller fold protein YncE